MNSYKNIYFFLGFIIISYTNSHAAELKGQATINVDSKIYVLPVQLCNGPRTDTYEGEVISTYSISAYEKNNNEPSYPQLNVYGAKEEGDVSASFIINLKQSFLEVVSGDMPYAIFNGKTLNYKGVADHRFADGSGGGDVPIEINISCE